MKNSRTTSSILNILTASFGSVMGILISFLNRIVFLHFLNATYLGVSGLFSNILLVFSLIDLGIGSALTQMFYKPFAEKDYKHLSQVTYTNKILLNIIGIIVFILTILVTPNLEVFVNDINAVPHMRLIFFMYGVSSSSTYFLGYYRTIITANQEAYKLVKIDNIWKVIGFLFKAIILAVSRNFILYLGMEILSNFLLNVVIRSFVRKQICEIDYNIKEFVPKSEQKKLMKNVVGVSLNKFANVVTNGTDNIIISKFLNLATVGLASNYTLMEQAVNGLVESIFTPLLASIGNLCVSVDTEEKYKHFKNFSFAAFWLYSFCSIALCVLSDNVIELFFGKEYLISRTATFFICFDLFCIGTFRVSTLFRTAQGLFWYGRFRPLLQAVVNLSVSLVLVSRTHQLWAVYAGTTASRILITVWYEPLIVLKYSLNKKPWKYYGNLLSYFIVYFISLYSTNKVVNILSINPFVDLFLGAIVCLILPNAIIIVIYYRTEEFKYWIKFIKELKNKICIMVS